MKIIYFMGKSASGKDTIYRKVKEKLNPSPKKSYCIRRDRYAITKKMEENISL